MLIVSDQIAVICCRHD